jgi:hypothetical protein
MQDATNTNGMVLYSEEYSPPFLPLIILAPFLLPFFWKYQVVVRTDTEHSDANIVKEVEKLEGTKAMEKATTLKYLTFGYNHAWTQRTVSSLDVEELSILKEDIRGLSQWGGWGIRYRPFPSGEWGYIATNGPGIRIHIRDHATNSSNVYLFNCRDPQRVYELMMMGDSEGDTNLIPNKDVT